MGNYAMGLDFGTLSVRALLLEVSTGRELFSSVYEHLHGVLGERLLSGQRIPTGLCLQDPGDYLEGFFTTVQKVLSVAKLQPEEIIGLGIDFTSSTVLPTTADGTPLCHMPEFRQEPHAYVKLWKHHGGTGEARRIEETAGEPRSWGWQRLRPGNMAGRV